MTLFCSGIEKDLVTLLRFSLVISRSSHVSSRQFVAYSIHTVIFLPISIFWFVLFFCSYVAIAVNGRRD